MNIRLCNPANGVTRIFRPHLWMFFLRSLTPPGHRVFLIDGNAQPLSDGDLADFVRKNRIGLAGIGMMNPTAHLWMEGDTRGVAGRTIIRRKQSSALSLGQSGVCHFAPK